MLRARGALRAAASPRRRSPLRQLRRRRRQQRHRRRAATTESARRPSQNRVRAPRRQLIGGGGDARPGDYDSTHGEQPPRPRVTGPRLASATVCRMTDSPSPTQHHGGHHRSARERQRRGPMWGCLRAILIGALILIGLLFLIVGGGYWYLGSSSFAGLVKLRIENTLGNRLGRKVTIGEVEVIRSRPQKIILRDLRIANAPGGVNPYFATVKEVVLTGGVDSRSEERRVGKE